VGEREGGREEESREEERRKEEGGRGKAKGKGVGS
jgi:hypothetical protein